MQNHKCINLLFFIFIVFVFTLTVTSKSTATEDVLPDVPEFQNLLLNPDFGHGGQSWSFNGEIDWQVLHNVLLFKRRVDSPTGASVAQNTNQPGASGIYYGVYLELGNTSPATKHVSVFLRDSSTWTGALRCDYAIPPFTPLQIHEMEGITGEWPNVRFELVVNDADGLADLLLDNVVVYYNPGELNKPVTQVDETQTVSCDEYWEEGIEPWPPYAVLAEANVHPPYGSGMCDPIAPWKRMEFWSETSVPFYVYLTLNTNDPSWSLNSADWTPYLPVTGHYRVEAFIPDHQVIQWECPTKTIYYDTSDARYTIHHANGQQTVSIDQKPLAHEWVTLGEFDFHAGWDGYVELTDLNGETNISRTVSFSMMRFELLSTPPPPTYYVFIPLVAK